MPAQRAHIPPYEPCQYPDPVAGDTCNGHAIAVISAIYTYDGGHRTVRIDEVLCRRHGMARIRSMMTAQFDQVCWHARSLATEASSRPAPAALASVGGAS